MKHYEYGYHLCIIQRRRIVLSQILSCKLEDKARGRFHLSPVPCTLTNCGILDFNQLMHQSVSGLNDEDITENANIQALLQDEDLPELNINDSDFIHPQQHIINTESTSSTASCQVK